MALGLDAPWAISCDWQRSRSLYYVRMPIEGWWVAADHSATMAALTRNLPAELSALGVPFLTSGGLEGENRALTTVVAEWVRSVVLDDDSLPLGMSFESKTLHGRCWAFWDRRADDGLNPASNDPSELRAEDNVDTPRFRAIAREYDLPVLPGRPLY